MNERVVIADGAMGTMLQQHDLTLDDFLQLEGCNEILNETRPDVIADIHAAYFDVGVDAVETNTFGANWSNLSDYGIDDRITDLAAPPNPPAAWAGVVPSSPQLVLKDLNNTIGF